MSPGAIRTVGDDPHVPSETHGGAADPGHCDEGEVRDGGLGLSIASRRNWLIAQEGVGAVARITLADYQRPLSASDGYVWLLEPGALDLPRIVKHRIEAP